MHDDPPLSPQEVDSDIKEKYRAKYGTENLKQSQFFRLKSGTYAFSGIAGIVRQFAAQIAHIDLSKGGPPYTVRRIFIYEGVRAPRKKSLKKSKKFRKKF
ncbi:hypothetical protein MnTg02_00080 [bacterium MnTg02]|nr:hypothetical protein MnTg02_00080 [bacterium MnTg02]